MLSVMSLHCLQTNTFFLFSILLNLFILGAASPTVSQSLTTTVSKLYLRADPVFPSDPPSCPICEKSYPIINSCAEAAPVLANFTNIVFNPGKFIDVIKCACADTFQAAFPQCVDCFVKTNQEDVLNTTNLPSVLSGMRQICGIESSLLGNVSSTDNSSATAEPEPGATSSISTNGAIIRNRQEFWLFNLSCFFIVMALSAAAF